MRTVHACVCTPHGPRRVRHGHLQCANKSEPSSARAVGNGVEGLYLPTRCGAAGAPTGAGIFLVACALRDSVAATTRVRQLDNFADKVAIQMNDKHPALAVAELMRSSSTSRTQRGIGRGDHASGRATPTTRCCRGPRQWPGSHSRTCCRVTCRSSTRSTTPAPAVRARFTGTSPVCRDVVVAEGTRRTCAWPTWRWRAVTR